MTLPELYAAMDGDYEQALKVLRIEKLIDKHIRKFPDNELFVGLVEAGKNVDAEALFEKTHAIKGVCANLGLTKIAALAAEVCEDFRPGRVRQLSDEEVRLKIDEMIALRERVVACIGEYAAQ